jgi:hypothetical protein
LYLREIKTQGNGENYTVMSFTPTSPNIIVMMKSEWMSQGEHSTLIGEQREAYTVIESETQKRGYHMQKLGLDGG